MSSGAAREYVRVARALRDLPVIRARFGAARAPARPPRPMTRRPGSGGGWPTDGGAGRCPTRSACRHCRARCCSRRCAPPAPTSPGRRGSRWRRFARERPPRNARRGLAGRGTRGVSAGTVRRPRRPGGPGPVPRGGRPGGRCPRADARLHRRAVLDDPRRRRRRAGQPDQLVQIPPQAGPRPRLPHRRTIGRRRVRLLPPRRHPRPVQPAPARTRRQQVQEPVFRQDTRSGDFSNTVDYIRRYYDEHPAA